MKKYKKHIFICEHVGDKKSSKAGCGKLGGKEIKIKFKKRISKLGLTESIRVNSSGCLGACKHGTVAVVYPKGTWYGNIKLEDVEKIIKSDLLNSKAVKELEIKNVK